MQEVMSVTTGFSEKGELNDRTFASVYDFDAEVFKLMASHPVTDLSYYKTDVTVTWKDGETVSFQVDANRTNNLATTFQSRYRFYCGFDRGAPEGWTPLQWAKDREEYHRFFDNYEIN